MVVSAVSTTADAAYIVFRYEIRVSAVTAIVFKFIVESVLITIIRRNGFPICDTTLKIFYRILPILPLYYLASDTFTAMP